MEKRIVFYIILTVSICIAIEDSVADTIWNPNRIRFYDTSTLRCSGRIISQGISQNEVIDLCGEPLRSARVYGTPYDVLIYQFGDYVYYMGIIDGQLKRMKRARCWKDNPDCE